MIKSEFMTRCIQLAQNGLGTSYPNPMVGSVIVHNNKIIGEGWHYKAGQAHAEVNAITNVANKSLLTTSTIYVSLEPCSHFGKTPPCSDLIINSGIKRVVIGTIDPFAAVAGRGVKKLMDAGCEVIVGVLEQECQELNKRFFTFHNNKRPYIFLKWAQSADGFLSPEVTKGQKRTPVWITNSFSKQFVHKQRAHEQAILVGTNTVVNDNPSLNTRLWKGTHVLRVVLDLNLRVPTNSTVFDYKQPTLVITTKKDHPQNTKNLSFEWMDSTKNIASQICDILYKKEIQSLIIEGGSQTLQTFIDANLWDEATVYTGNTVLFKKGTKAPSIKGSNKTSTIKNDFVTHYTNFKL
ncbi:bifunctional diaminohydroxyphosphoribosylaminopyrimidine deaminase/5-amino-6-(5-phosphoribosylamino)uracil reductase RibD [Aquimarina agarilytica]|uniref:bifunctional diaminohydroxyphosphoribosylaminopyrimidine deaminase/5-amino-6-(5-phosphoribosylamino)uracil reductase RibD n=1 Tax=Aquimarina agarilytica TaxID=1087449 RepID=UPI00028A1B09|nr:bifunctional diaminohydroxyphosphoribosylaminopyrimidine deaminase/5-amino-6-(5-phosphoribosylamino)uracil reductase RibD [Aquimarina agarilytica]